MCHWEYAFGDILEMVQTSERDVIIVGTTLVVSLCAICLHLPHICVIENCCQFTVSTIYSDKFAAFFRHDHCHFCIHCVRAHCHVDFGLFVSLKTIGCVCILILSPLLVPRKSAFHFVLRMMYFFLLSPPKDMLLEKNEKNQRD